jgi:CheY-like chemotaxis protein
MSKPLVKTMCGNKTVEPHILFVDDNPDILELVQVVLQAAGFRVSTADSTAVALQLAASERFEPAKAKYQQQGH